MPKKFWQLAGHMSSQEMKLFAALGVTCHLSEVFFSLKTSSLVKVLPSASSSLLKPP